MLDPTLRPKNGGVQRESYTALTIISQETDIMRRIMLLLAAAVVSTPLWAMHCPMDMAKIDKQLETNPPSDPATLEKVKELRAEGEQLHKAGDHTQSLQVLEQAQALLDSAD